MLLINAAEQHYNGYEGLILKENVLRLYLNVRDVRSKGRERTRVSLALLQIFISVINKWRNQNYVCSIKKR